MTAADAPAVPGRTPTLLVAPHARLGAPGLSALAGLQAVAGLALARAGVRFDGAIDVHTTWAGDPVPWGVALLDQLVAWPVAALAALAVLRLAGDRVAWWRVALVVGSARVALVLVAALVATLPPPSELLPALQRTPAGALPTLPPTTSPGTLIAAATGMVILAIWYVALLVGGLRWLTASRGRRLAARVVGVLVAMELASVACLALMG